MGFLRRRRQPDNALPGRVPAPPPHEPVIDPSSGLAGYAGPEHDVAAGYAGPEHDVAADYAEPEHDVAAGYAEPEHDVAAEQDVEPVLELPEDAPEPVSDPDEQLRRLSDLHERGLLDAEDFARQRRRVLGR